MPARTLNDFCAGFFYGQIRAGLEVAMGVPKRADQRKTDSRRNSRRKSEIETISGKTQGDTGQEVTVRHPFSQEKKASVWAWHEEFRIAWSETFITSPRKRNPRKGERG
jgi:hypothetical protein